MLTIALLGTPEILRDGEPVTINRRKSRALLFFVAAHAQPVMREQVLAVFWPEMARSAAQQSLRTTLYGIRQAAGDVLRAEDERLALDSEASVDVRQFEEALAAPDAGRAALAAALALYRGDFLQGFGLDGAPEFDDWLVAQGEHYRRRALRGWVMLAHQHEAAGSFRDALEALEQALALDPLQEDVQRAALRLHYLSGDRAGAIRRYDHLRRLLDDELGVPPMAETRALYDAILSDALEVPAPAIPLARPAPLPVVRRDSVIPFTGRAHELAHLRALVDHPAPRLVLIEGEAGIGKTRLAAEFIATLEALPLTGSARELEQNLPYQPVIEALRGLRLQPSWPVLRARLESALPPVWLAETARLLPELLPNPPSLTTPDEARLWEGVHQFLRALTSVKPVVLFIDDLHWADTSTLALLGYLIRQPGTAPLGFLTTARPVPPGSPLGALQQALTRAGQLARVPLARLTREAIDTIAQQISPAGARPLADWLAQASEGNPYVLAELVRHARANDLVGPDGAVDEAALSASPVVPHTIYSLIQMRLARLSEPARRVLDAAVAMGREFEFDVVYRAAGLSESAALDALDELQAADLVLPLDGLRYRFDHTLTLEVAYREVGEARHRLLHRRVAEALDLLHGRDPDTAGLIAYHYSEGGAPDRAAPYAFRAGQRAAQVAAWDQAVGFFEQVVAVSNAGAVAGASAVPRFEALMALGSAHFRAGQVRESSEVYRQALAWAETAGHTGVRCAARLALAESLLLLSQYAEAIGLVAQFPVPQTVDDLRMAAKSEQIWGTALSLQGIRLEDAARHLQRGKAYLDAARTRYPETPLDPIHGAELDFELGSIAAQQGDLTGAIALYRAALAAAEQSQDRDAIMRVILAHNNLAYHLHLLGDPAALDHAERGLALAADAGMMALLPYLLSTRGEIALAAGDLDTAEKHFQRGLALAQQTHHQERIAGLTANLGLVAQARGETLRAVSLLTAARQQADALGTQHLAAQVRLWLAPLLPPDEARLALDEARALAETGGRQRLLAEADRIEAALDRI